jgi:serine/threonine protein phosphatase PrpC
MADSWFYTHDGKTYGPADAATLRRLAAEGKLAPDDLVWPEGGSAVTAAPARSLVPFAGQTPAPGAVPDWLGDVRRAEASEPSPALPATPPLPPTSPQPSSHPDWLEDVKRREGPAPAPPAPVAVPVAQPVSVQPAAPLARQTILEVGGATTPGMVRDRNEDSSLVLQAAWTNLDQRHEMAIIVVADGMGGAQAGDRASGLIVATMGKALAGRLAEAAAGSDGAATIGPALDSAFALAHQTVAEAAADPACKGMGATTVALVVHDRSVHIALVGDCRVYHHRANKLARVTRDQTLVNRMVELGQLTPQEAVNHPRANEVTQAVGQRSIQPVHTELALAPGDWLLAACDGLYAHLEDQVLQDLLNGWTASAAELAAFLVRRVDQLGGSDNCTVVAVRVR